MNRTPVRYQAEGLQSYMIQDKSVNEDEIYKLTKKEKDRVKLCGNIIKS